MRLGKPQLDRHEPIDMVDTSSEVLDGGGDAAEQTEATHGLTRAP